MLLASFVSHSQQTPSSVECTGYLRCNLVTTSTYELYLKVVEIHLYFSYMCYPPKLLILTGSELIYPSGYICANPQIYCSFICTFPMVMSLGLSIP